MSKHAFLSASGAPAWTRCEAKVWREKDLPDETSSYAEEGTLAHELLEKYLTEFEPDGSYPEEMHRQVRKTLDYIATQNYNLLYAEQRLDISFLTTEEGAQGTADVVLLNDTELTIIDLKYGLGVEVEAVGNEQLLLYGVAALREFDLLGEVETLKMVISQPRLDAISEWILPVEQIEGYVNPIKRKAVRILSAEGGGANLCALPGEKQCKFCKVKGTCPEQRGHALAIVTDDFVDLDKEDEFLAKVKDSELRLATSDDKHLATCMDAVDMIENWCKAVRGQIEKRLFAGNFSDPRYKLVQGKRGHRKWADEKSVEEAFILEPDLYEKKLKSPATLEKEWKGRPHYLEKMRKLLTQSEGKPSVAPAIDKRPALVLELEFLDLDKEDPEYAESLAGLTKE